MVVSFNTQALSGLCSEDQLELLDAVDRLRLQGLDHYVSLPQIIVCGDQSSGKSSVLEAISGVPFPVKSNLCTRFPTELVLRRTAKIGVTVSIVPHSSLGLSEQSRLAGFHEKLDGFEGFPALVEKAKSAMGISTHGKAFAKDLLRVEITGPNRPHLTIVDLPGLIHSETKQQSADDVELVQDVVTSYMKQRRSIILAVISAKNDFANQIVLKLARTADHSGTRTMGVITKPDTLVPDSDSELLYASLAQNHEVEFRLGWHVLKNIDSEKVQGASLLAERDAEETVFFSQGIWSKLPSSMLGIDELRPKLSNVLIRQIARELPSLISEINVGISSCQKLIKALGVPRITPDEQRLELLRISQKFQALVKASVDGTYNDAFFENAKTERGYQQRIRAVVQNLNKQFSDELLQRGHSREMCEKDDYAGKLSTRKKGQPVLIEREQFISRATTLLRRTKARELPNLFNPMVVADLFHEQSAPWNSIVDNHVQVAWNAAKTFLELVICSISDTTVSAALMAEVFEPALEKLVADTKSKTSQLLNAHRSIHPITYTREYTESILNIWDERRRQESTQAIKNYFKVTKLEWVKLNGEYDLTELIDLLAEQREPDIERIAASEALDCMHAYYNVAMKRFLDDISVEVIEEKLLAVLGDILSPVKVFGMPPALVATIAGEPRDVRAKRRKLTKQLDVLKKGSETCKRFIGVRLGDDDSDYYSEEEAEGGDKDDDTAELEKGEAATPDDKLEERKGSIAPDMLAGLPFYQPRADEYQFNAGTYQFAMTSETVLGPKEGRLHPGPVFLSVPATRRRFTKRQKHAILFATILLVFLVYSLHFKPRILDRFEGRREVSHDFPVLLDPVSLIESINTYKQGDQKLRISRKRIRAPNSQQSVVEGEENLKEHVVQDVAKGTGTQNAHQHGSKPQSGWDDLELSHWPERPNLRADLDAIFALQPDEIKMREYLRPINNGGPERMRELGLRTRAYQKYLSAWEELHLVTDKKTGEVYIRDDVIQYLRSMEEDKKTTSPALAHSIHNYEAFRSFLVKFARILFPFTSPYFADHMTLHSQFKNAGRGIVLTAGDEQAQYLLTTIYTFRELGCDLPIEVMYLGDEDLGEDHRFELEVSRLLLVRSSITYTDNAAQALPGVTTRDISEMVDDSGWKLAGWAIKPFAMLMSSFREVIFIDADSFFFRDPASLFDDPGYKKTGALFFRDRTIMPESKRRWLLQILPRPIHQLAKESSWWTGASGHHQESGVVVVDKWKHFVSMLLICRFNGSDRDPKDGKMGVYEMMHGDKETFWIGFLLAGDTSFAFHKGAVGSIGVVDPPNEIETATKFKPTLSLSERKEIEDQLSVGAISMPETYTMCSPQLLHLDVDGTPLWFNGWLLVNKYAERSKRKFAPMMSYLREPKDKAIEDDFWKLTTDNMCCLTVGAESKFDIAEHDMEILKMMRDRALEVGL
ncbi:hypothetical protein NUW58_g2344 [Xylaria curta]|uniref:Uncharacterized protein n=1 Tax=Xylaria curta TaxID=42375 RepID=A0ACC1PHE2_9PEZI|nr:hypothetical protein NUW58_g2344 [Xylaria curta]